MTTQPRRLDYLDLLLKSAPQALTLDVSGYPADVQATLTKLYELWGLMPPDHKKTKAFWIDGARQVKAACGEFGLALLDAYHAEWEAMADPHIVATPKSLVSMLAGYAGQVRTLRSKGRQSKYTSGAFSEFVER